MSKLTNKQVEQAKLAATCYANYNAADYIAVAKPMRGTWYYAIIPLTVEVMQTLISDVEDTDSDGLKFRVRPNNRAFYAVAGANAEPLASVETVDAMVVSIAAETGCRVNRGHAVERLIAERLGLGWQLNNLQTAWWKIPDMTDDDGRKIQVKAYGGSILERDIRRALAIQ